MKTAWLDTSRRTVHTPTVVSGRGAYVGWMSKMMKRLHQTLHRAYENLCRRPNVGPASLCLLGMGFWRSAARGCEGAIKLPG